MNILTTARTVAAGATLGLASANPIGIAVGVAGVVGFALMKVGGRPSTLVRVTEDAAITSATRVVRGTKTVARGAKAKTTAAAKAVRTEYAARRLAAAHRELVRQTEQIAGMTKKELRAFTADQRAIQLRAAELAGIELPRAKRKAAAKKVPAKKTPRAARSGRRA